MSSTWKASVAMAVIGIVLGGGYALRAQGRSGVRGYRCRAVGDDGEPHAGGHFGMSSNEDQAKRRALQMCAPPHPSCHLEGACETVTDPGDEGARRAPAN